MFQPCYRGHVPTTISCTTRHRAPAYCRRVLGQSRSHALDITGVLLGQLSDSSRLNHIDDILAVAHTCGGIGLHQTRLGEKIEVPIQAGSADIHRSLQAPNGRRAEHRQAAQDIHSGTVAQKTDCHLNFGRQFWSDQAWHGSILPDAMENQCLLCHRTLLLSNGAQNGLTRWLA
jgi:hypothetical protein